MTRPAQLLCIDLKEELLLKAALCAPPDAPAWAALEEAGLRPVGEALVALQSHDIDQRWRALSRYSPAQHPAIFQAFLEAARAPVARLRREAARALSAYEEAKEVLLPMLAESDPYLRRAAQNAVRAWLFDAENVSWRAQHRNSPLATQCQQALWEALSSAVSDDEQLDELKELVVLSCDELGAVPAPVLQRLEQGPVNPSLCTRLASSFEPNHLERLLALWTGLESSSQAARFLSGVLLAPPRDAKRVLLQLSPAKQEKGALLALALGLMGQSKAVDLVSSLNPQRETVTRRCLEALILLGPAAKAGAGFIDTARQSESKATRRLAEVCSYAVLGEGELHELVQSYAEASVSSDAASVDFDGLVGMTEEERLRGFALRALLWTSTRPQPQLAHALERARTPDALSWSLAQVAAEALAEWQHRPVHGNDTLGLWALFSAERHKAWSIDELALALRSPELRWRARALSVLGPRREQEEAQALIETRRKDLAPSIRMLVAALLPET
ncbi:MAG: hypothetical protein RBU37_12210 [Myxococcota bacterium]|jgi:hypothetical protein|nr:hypothetical protein [Myxococcota bacterium]